MAAQEYFSGAPMTSSGPAPQQQQPPHAQQQQQPPPPPAIQTQSNLGLPYPMSDQPPPYSPAHSDQPRPHSQPPPGQRIPQQQLNAQAYQPYRPNQPNIDTHQYPPEKVPFPQQQQRQPPVQGMYQPSNPPYAQPPPFQPLPNGYAAAPTAVAPGLSQVYPSQQRPSSAGQAPYRRSSRSPRRRHHSKPQYEARPAEPQRQKSGGMNTFLGAGGGAIIGDLIFPGLGTLGGAIIGGVGGHEYTKNNKNKTHRSRSNPSGAYRRSYSSSGDYESDSRRGRN